MDMQQSLDFLAALQKNNDKAWMKTHRSTYQQARNTCIEMAGWLISHLTPYDKSVAALIPQSCIFRINRDIRFSKDKSSYKTNMGAYFAPKGRNSGYAGYYLHIEPHDQSFIAGGLYQPTTAMLQRIRQEIDYNAAELVQIIDAPEFKKLFGTLQGEKLKRPPQGYQADHPQVELLKMKSFLAMRSVKDKTVAQPDFFPCVLEVFQAMVPLVQFLNTAIDA